MSEEDTRPEGEAPAPASAASPEGQEGAPAPDIAADEAALPEPPHGEKYRPFAYIDYGNLKRLIYLLRKEPPQVTAVILPYLKPEFTQKILSALPVSLKVSVIQESAKVRIVSPKQMMEIDARVKDSVDLVIGGWEQAAVLLENADEKTREAIFAQLRRENPMVYDKLKKAMFRFEDITNIPFESMRVIIRELKTGAIATALHGAPPQIINKFRTSMLPGGDQLVLETIKFSKPPDPADVQKERDEIILVIRRLEKEGQVFLDDEGARSFLDGLEEEAAPLPEAKPGTPAEAAQYLNAGVAHYQGGRVEKSLEYFQYALSCDPSLWQAHQWLGAAFYSLNRLAEARMHYEKLIQIHPDPTLTQWYETFKKNLA